MRSRKTRRILTGRLDQKPTVQQMLILLEDRSDRWKFAKFYYFNLNVHKKKLIWIVSSQWDIQFYASYIAINGKKLIDKVVTDWWLIACVNAHDL